MLSFRDKIMCKNPNYQMCSWPIDFNIILYVLSKAIGKFYEYILGNDKVIGDV